MSKSGFYSSLARQSIKNNAKYYIPYFLSCIGSAAMFYIMFYLNGSKALDAMRGGGTLRVVLILGAIIIAIFSALVLFYTNGFLMKRRERELGLYNVLGMEKRHIGILLLWESFYSALIGIIGGLAVGILLSKLLLLILCSILHFEVPFGFEISTDGIWITVAVFCIIFILNLLNNLHRVGRSRPIEMLRSANTAEREPKSKWILNVVGVLALGGGYAIALAVESPIKALGLFFIAVLLVIIGTYCLFTSGSIAVLKLLRKNKKYYYKTRHFTAISGMLHRMKRNAAGLASICILSTMVLVTVSSTLCLYLGADEVLSDRYPNDISLVFKDPGPGTDKAAHEAIAAAADKQGVRVDNISEEKSLELSLRLDGNRLIRDEQSIEYSLADDNIVIAYFISADTYAAQTGAVQELRRGQALVQAFDFTFDLPEQMEIMSLPFEMCPVDNFPKKGEVSSYVAKMLCFVVCDDDLYALSEASKAVYDNNVSVLTMRIGFNVDAVSAQQIAFADELMDELSSGKCEYDMLYTDCRAEGEGDFYAMYGGFFFLGIFLGTLFLMATVLIIYYKQISEGYEDAERFKIMQQVGMSRQEVKSSIHSQIMTVFFLPLAMAGVHIAFAFKMITRLLEIFSLYNVKLFALCCIGAFLIFALIYAAIYSLTAKAYYKIVRT